MKRFIYSLSMLLGLSAAVHAQDAVVIDDYDFNRNMNAWKPDSGQYIFDTEAMPGSIDNKVGQYNLDSTILANGASWLGTRVSRIMGASGDWAGWNIDDYPYISVNVYSDHSFNLGLKVEDGCCGDPKPKLAEHYKDYKTPGEWKALVFDLTEGVGLGIDNEVVILIDLWNESTEKTLFFDDWTAHKTMPDSNEIVKSVHKTNVLSSNFSVYPNPAKGEATVNYELLSPQTVSLTVADLQGLTLSEISEISAAPGTNNTPIDISNLSPGMYVVSVKSETNIESRTLVVE